MSTHVYTTEATLSTLKVEIKALTVSGKQMTLAVFKQLPQWWPLTVEETLNNDVRFWGIVRYSIKDEGDLWVVLEKDNELHRAKIEIYLNLNDLNHDELNDAEMLIEHAKQLPVESYWEVLNGQFPAWASNNPTKSKQQQDKEHTIADCQAKRNAILRRLHINHKASVDWLLALPQLFIAV